MPPEGNRDRPRCLSLRLTADEVARLEVASAACASIDMASDADGFVAAARRARAAIPFRLAASLSCLGPAGSPAALVIRGLPVFGPPATPERPEHARGRQLKAAGLLGIIACALGEPYGFSAELGGLLIQDVVPVRGLEHEQQSVSSRQALTTHVELAFADDNDRADYVLLFCLRADHQRQAATTVSCADSMLAQLPADAIAVLRQRRYRTRIDASFRRGLGEPGPLYAAPIAVIQGSPGRPELRVDFAETEGTDPAAQSALDDLQAAAGRVAVPLALDAGDMLVIDNRRACHGRSSFSPRYDGRDRWLLRTSVARDLARSARHRPGNRRVIYLQAADLASPQPEELAAGR
jgi:L-asparagine oxygenase